MLPFRKILFATDFSPVCEAVVPYVKDLTTRYDAELAVLHVSNAAPVVYGEYAAFVADSVPLYAEMRNRACEDLKKFTAAHFPGFNPQLILEDGEAAAMIEKVVARERIDLVIMPTHGRGPLRRLLLGSVTAKVLHDTGCAVWTDVHQQEPEYQPRIPYQSVVCAVNFDAEAPALVTAAAAIARKYDAELTLAHIAELPPANYAVDLGPYRKAVLDWTEAELRRIASEVGAAAKLVQLAGPAAPGIRQIVLDCKGDLLVVGRGQAHKTIQRMWSNLYPIIRESPCPVLSV